MGYKIDEIEGIGPSMREKLAAARIATTEDLLQLCCTPKGRNETAAKTGISASLLLKWANMADLMRISGIGRQFAELLEASGVDTVKELRSRNFENLTAQMSKVNDVKKLSRTTPPASLVKRWIEQAQQTEPAISH